MTFLGELIGGVFWGWIGDRFGRRKSFIGTVALSTLFGFLSAAAPSFYWLVAFRLLLGIALGTFLLLSSFPFSTLVVSIILGVLKTVNIIHFFFL